MGSCIAVVSEMIFATRITRTAEKVGAKCKIINDADVLRDSLEAHEPETVLIDMNCDGILAEEAIRTVKSLCPNTRVVAFFSHVQTELKEQARVAGADDLWSRYAFVLRLPQVLEAVGRPSRP